VRRHAFRIGLVVVAVVALVAGVWFVRAWRDRGPDEASVDDALQRYRASSSTVEDPIGVARPEPGVYEYEGHGDERLSFLATSQRQGPSMPATVTLEADGCWTLALEFNSFHTQTWDWCLDAAGVVETGGLVEQSFDFAAFKVDEHSVSRCDPPVRMLTRGAQPGQEWARRCSTVSSTARTTNVSEGVVVFVGLESLMIAGAAQPALHYRVETTISGGQEGEDRLDVWFAPDTSLLLRASRDLRVTSPAPAPLDEVTYTESGEFTIRTIAPMV